MYPVITHIAWKLWQKRIIGVNQFVFIRDFDRHWHNNSVVSTISEFQRKHLSRNRSIPF